MVKFQEENPSNSRIKIDYTKTKPNVTFFYPNKHHPFKIIFSTARNIWVYLNLIIALILFAVIQVTNLNGNGLDSKLYIELYIASIYFILPPLIFTLLFINNEKLLRNMPKINMALSLFPRGKYYYKEITSLNKKFYEIPIFDNVFLDYNAEGEFSKYLEKVEIVEHDLDYCTASIFSKKVKKTRNDSLWKARFIFSEIPKKGVLQIKFK